MTEPRSGSYGWLGRLHRGAAVLFALGLWTFGVLGLVNRLEFFSTEGQPVLGLSSNGLLSVISLVVGGVLIVGAVRGGRTASTVLVVVGALFMLSGVANAVLLDGPLNLLGFEIPNVVFSLLAGGMLVVVGAYGRFTGRLPDANPYNRGRGGVTDGSRDSGPDPIVVTAPGDVRAAIEMADAERSVIDHTATPEQTARVKALVGVRRAEDRMEKWRGSRPDSG